MTDFADLGEPYMPAIPDDLFRPERDVRLSGLGLAGEWVSHETCAVGNGREPGSSNIVAGTYDVCESLARRRRDAARIRIELVACLDGDFARHGERNFAIQTARVQPLGECAHRRNVDGRAVSLSEALGNESRQHE